MIVKLLPKRRTPDEIYQEPVTKTRNRIESRKAEIFIDPLFTHDEKWELAEDGDQG